jgi:hypothetical protein
LREGFHFSISLSKELWRELLLSTLPVELAYAPIELRKNARALWSRLQLPAMRRTRHLLGRMGRRLGSASEAGAAVRIQGLWRLEIDEVGAQSHYGEQEVGVEAFVRATAEGSLFLADDRLEIPFYFEKRIGTSMKLRNLHYEPCTETLVGSLTDLTLHVGEPFAAQLLARVGEVLLEQQIAFANPIPILSRERVEQMVGPLSGPLHAEMGVDEMALEVSDDEMTLLVRFGFRTKQLVQQPQSGQDL